MVGRSNGVQASVWLNCALCVSSLARLLLYLEEGPPLFAGAMLWRGCVERYPYLSGASMMIAGHANRLFIFYPVSSKSAKRGRSLLNWACLQ